MSSTQKKLEEGDNTEVNGIRGLTKPKGIGTLVLDLEDYKGKLHNIIFKNFYYFPGASKLSSLAFQNSHGTEGKMKLERKGPISR